MTGELAANAIAGMLYPDVKDLSTLSEEQKQTVSALATISAGMAGGLAGDSTGSAVAGGWQGRMRLRITRWRMFWQQRRKKNRVR